MLAHFRELFIGVGLQARNEMRSKSFQQAQPSARVTSHPDLTGTGGTGLGKCSLEVDLWALKLGKSITLLDPGHHGLPFIMGSLSP